MYSISVNGGKPFEVEPAGGEGTIDGESFRVDVVTDGSGSYHLLSGGKGYRIDVLSFDRAEKKIVLRINGNKYQAIYKDKFDLLVESMGLSAAGAGKLNEFKAPMPGLVLDIYVQEGSEVKKGDPMVVLEAMKMENVLKAPGDGTVKQIKVSKKQAVEKNQVLVTFA